MGARPGQQPLEERLAEDRGDVRIHTVAGACGSGRLQSLDCGRGNAFHEDAAQQLQAGCIARVRADDLDGHPERPEEPGEALGAGAGSERGCREAEARNHSDQRDVRELHRQ